MSTVVLAVTKNSIGPFRFRGLPTLPLDQDGRLSFLDGDNGVPNGCRHGPMLSFLTLGLHPNSQSQQWLWGQRTAESTAVGSGQSQSHSTGPHASFFEPVVFIDDTRSIWYGGTLWRGTLRSMYRDLEGSAPSTREVPSPPTPLNFTNESGMSALPSQARFVTRRCRILGGRVRTVVRDSEI